MGTLESADDAGDDGRFLLVAAPRASRPTLGWWVDQRNGKISVSEILDKLGTRAVLKAITLRII